MYVETKRTVKVNDEDKYYADIYVESNAEALTIPSTNYVVGSKMYIVPTGEMYIACSTGWFDTDGTELS